MHPQESREHHLNCFRHVVVDFEKTRTVLNFLIADRDHSTIVKTTARTDCDVRFDSLGGLLSFKLREIHKLKQHHLTRCVCRIKIFTQTRETAAVCSHEVPHFDKISNAAR